MTGWNADVKDDSWEGQEERRVEAERIEKERLAKLESEKKEHEKLAQQALERERLAIIEQKRLEQEKINRKRDKERELAEAVKKYDNALLYWNNYGSRNPNKDAGHPGQAYTWNAAEWNKVASADNEVKRITEELKALK